MDLTAAYFIPKWSRARGKTTLIDLWIMRCSASSQPFASGWVLTKRTFVTWSTLEFLYPQRITTKRAGGQEGMGRYPTASSWPINKTLILFNIWSVSLQKWKSKPIEGFTNWISWRVTLRGKSVENEHYLDCWEKISRKASAIKHATIARMGRRKNRDMSRLTLHNMGLLLWSSCKTIVGKKWREFS